MCTLSLTDRDSSTIRGLVPGDNKKRGIMEKILAAPSVRQNMEISAMFGRKKKINSLKDFSTWYKLFKMHFWAD